MKLETYREATKIFNAIIQCEHSMQVLRDRIQAIKNGTEFSNDAVTAHGIKLTHLFAVDALKLLETEFEIKNKEYNKLTFDFDNV